jgi:hypothetical protein
MPLRIWTRSSTRSSHEHAKGQITHIATVVDSQAFQALSHGERRFMTGAYYAGAKRRLTTTGAPSKPYFLAFMNNIMAATKFIRTAGEKVDFVFDRNPVLLGHAKQLHDAVFKYGLPEMQRRVGQIDFALSRDSSALQAADLLTYCSYQMHVLQAARQPARQDLARAIRKLHGLRNAKRGSVALFDARRMEHFLGELPKAVRENLL